MSAALVAPLLLLCRQAVNSLTIPHVYVVNRSDAPLDLTFTLLAADGSGPFESTTTSARTVSAGTEVLPNPMHVDPHSSRKLQLAWRHGGGDPAQHVIAGVVLDVRHGGRGYSLTSVSPTAGFEYPESMTANLMNDV